MAWTVEYTSTATSDLRKLDKTIAQRVVDYVDERIATGNDPRQFGRALTGTHRGLWRYRVGGYRIICNFQDDVLRVLVVRVARRDTAYR